MNNIMPLIALLKRKEFVCYIKTCW